MHARLATSAVQQSTLATDRHIVIWHAVHQTERLEADVSLGMLIIYWNRGRKNKNNVSYSAHSLEGELE